MYAKINVIKNNDECFSINYDQTNFFKAMW